MGVPGNANALLLRSAAAAGGYQVSRSLRFNSSDSAYLSRTPASAGNRKTWTWAGWVKRSSLSTGLDVNLFTGGVTNSDTGFMGVYIDNNHKLTVAGATTNFLVSNSVYRDVSAWYHIIAAFDATQGTNANKIKLYVNGDLLTNFAIDNRASISNQDYGINQAAAHAIGRSSLNGARYFDGYLADIYFIDGQALDPSSFTEVSATTGQLIPKQYTGSFGTNGFWLKFSDNSAATATTLGKDYSGNNNNWTPNNLSVTAGAGNDSLVDTPTTGSQVDTGLGGQVTGNYCTLNPLDNGGITLSNGNLDASSTTSAWRHVRSTIGITSGKYYAEITCTSTANSTNTLFAGIAKSTASLSNYTGADGGGWGYYANDGSKRTGDGTAVGYGATWGNGDVIGIALDADAGTLTFYKNGTSQGQAYSGLTSGPYFFAISLYGTISATFNAGQRPFAYTAPTGFKALCDTNLPAPVVAKPNTVMDVKLYTGNGSTQTISGLGFGPDLVWVKSRNNASWWHVLTDAVRGGGYFLHSNNTNAEGGGGTSLITGFTSDGFSLNNSPNGTVNALNDTYVAWTWDAGSSTVTNTQGSITSSVRANASAGFSVVTWTGQTAAGSIGHGLNAAPSLIICKARSNAQSWGVYHKDVGINNYLLLDSTGASTAYSGIWGSSAPTSTVFSVPGNVGLNNNNGWTYVGYCFAPVAGYSSFGSYTSNGSSDGPFVYTGFRPRWIMIKCSSSNQSGNAHWAMYDTSRLPTNEASSILFANLSLYEFSTYSIDILSNGFKIRDVDGEINGGTNTYIYAAFAESPFNYSRAR